MKSKDELGRFAGRETLYYEKRADKYRGGFIRCTGKNSRMCHCTHRAIVPGDSRVIGMNMADLHKAGEGDGNHTNQA